MMSDPFEFAARSRLAYIGSPLDRASERRGHAKLMADASESAETRALIVSGDQIVLQSNRSEIYDPLFTLADAAALGTEGEPIFLGFSQGSARLGYSLAPENAERLKSRDDLMVADLRMVAIRGLVEPQHLQPIAAAKAVLAWHARHRYCANCGAPTRIAEAGWRRDCDACHVQHFPRTDPCVIMLAIEGENCLLGRAARFPAGMWSCLAGFVEPGESLEEAVRRETREEAGVEVGRVVYLGSQPWPFPMSLMIGCFAEAKGNTLEIDRNEVEDARWFSRAEAELMLARKHPDGLTTPPPMAIAHHIVRVFVENGPAVLKTESEEP